jgi:hypothetical protein
MIRRDELLSIAQLKGLAPRLAEMDYLQDVALLVISRHFGNDLVFKGGTCLYKAYKLNRFSEDLDFSAAKSFKPRDFFKRLPYLFGLLNITCHVHLEEFQNSLNARLQISGPLYDGRKESLSTLLLDISRRERVLLPAQRFPYSSLYSEIPSFDLHVMDKREIFAEKIRAIYSRNKARDVYDLWYLARRRNIAFDSALVAKKLSSIGLKFDMRPFLSKLDEKKESWGKDLGSLINGELPPFGSVREELAEALEPAG